MQLVPTQEEVIALLRQTGALRQGHFIYPNGLHSDEYLQVPLAFRHYQHARTLSVSLARLLRADPELRPVLPELSVVAPATGGLPVAFGICEALRAKQVYWAERLNDNEPLRFRQFLEQTEGEKVLLVDDILRSGKNLMELKNLLEENGAKVLALGVIVYQPTPKTIDFSPLPVYYLAKLEETYFSDGADSHRWPADAPAVKVWI